MAERLQKWLAARGLGSRRQIEAWIGAGRITIDGITANLGAKVDGTEHICLDGAPVDAGPAAAHRTLMLNKPAGVICSRRDPGGRPTVFDDLPRLRGGRWLSVGRLDLQTSGLLLLTTDGDLAAALMHPRSGVERQYAVRVEGGLDETMLGRLRGEVILADGPVRVLALEPAGGEGRNRWYRVTLNEGRNRIVRRLMEHAGVRVSRLIRLRYGPVNLPRDLPRGRHRPVTGKLLASLYRAAGLVRKDGSRAREQAQRQSRI